MLKLLPVRTKSSALRQLISKKKWSRLSKYLSSEEGRSDATHAIHDKDGKGHSAFHAACASMAPLAILRELHSIHPEAVFEVDKSNATPLHAAVKQGATVEVVKFLLYHNPEAALMKDSRGKTPLHLACEVETIGEYQSPFWLDVIEIIKVLCDAAPRWMDIQDLKGRNAIEYAVSICSHEEVIRVLTDKTGDLGDIPKIISIPLESKGNIATAAVIFPCELLDTNNFSSLS
mmetsp:Transcript_16880/g.24732  ORF Transcript_16880/g.24732 Transcript_16880/m.24732 type:complete len:232 (+) Transcript_16880:58-753(+)